MFKKLVVATAVVAACSSVAFADAAPYIGAGLGVNNTIFNSKADGQEVNLGSRGALLNVFAGYGATVNQNVYLGGEVFTNTTSTDIKEGTGKWEQHYTYGASFIPGFLLSDSTMAFGRIGVVKTRFEIKADPIDDKTTVTGAQFGLGLQTSLTQNIALRGEYDYATYRSYNVEGAKFNPSNDQFTVSVVYKFQ